MIVVDTNAVSEAARGVPDTNVDDWFDHRIGDELYVTATIMAELCFGIELMPLGRRRSTLQSRIDLVLGQYFADRVLPFDGMAARAYATIHATRRRSGCPMSMADAQIAATCLVNGATLATRNVCDFQGCGIRLVNPWAR
ncbi:MAG: type II toxin-antitoxin system VapC family toxin [Microbacteriaceae bacterium]|nr:MAG: type II toxin-antitoxin system VapC family toxin [Microbacteriaceae bacterium]